MSMFEGMPLFENMYDPEGILDILRRGNSIEEILSSDEIDSLIRRPQGMADDEFKAYKKALVKAENIKFEANRGVGRTERVSPSRRGPGVLMGNRPGKEIIPAPRGGPIVLAEPEPTTSRSTRRGGIQRPPIFGSGSTPTAGNPPRAGLGVGRRDVGIPKAIEIMGGDPRVVRESTGNAGSRGPVNLPNEGVDPRKQIATREQLNEQRARKAARRARGRRARAELAKQGKPTGSMRQKTGKGKATDAAPESKTSNEIRNKKNTTRKFVGAPKTNPLRFLTTQTGRKVLPGILAGGAKAAVGTYGLPFLAGSAVYNAVSTLTGDREEDQINALQALGQRGKMQRQMTGLNPMLEIENLASEMELMASAAERSATISPMVRKMAATGIPARQLEELIASGGFS